MIALYALFLSGVGLGAIVGYCAARLRGLSPPPPPPPDDDPAPFLVDPEQMFGTVVRR